MKRILGLALWAMATTVLAQDAGLRLPVNGEIGIDPTGAVFDYRIDTELTPEVKSLVERSVRQWKFEPVLRDGKATHAKARVHLTLIAREVTEGFQLQVEDVRFSGYRDAVSMKPPRYPKQAAINGVGGDVLVAVRVDASGKVIDAVAVQTSWPYKKVAAKAAEKWGALLETASVEAAREWTFEPVDTALHEQGDTTLIVPISYRMNVDRPPREGWHYESAGPARPIPWLAPSRQAFDASGLKDGEVLALDYSVKLKTPVVGTAL
ncbi:energy transducer TonB [Pseudoxanthomonas beigongshangi]|uniref:energy transducer TonB n=1 Tax=Pseudoxanthomonas beigongshangi TaxID=2782537 RepID=UPI00193B48E4|nr:energy transducer TonB [Pseudoxanthomonas beigongshangi]